jgi:hypothetical protein
LNTKSETLNPETLKQKEQCFTLQLPPRPIAQSPSRPIVFSFSYGKFPDYYANNPKSSVGKEIRIEGSVSICDLKLKTMESHFGYYCDQWIKLTLLNYIV